MAHAATEPHGTLRLERRGDAVRIACEGLPAHADAHVLLAVVEDGLSNKVLRGENQGRTRYIGDLWDLVLATNTTDVIQLWVTDILVPYNRVVSNINILSGGTATTDNWLAAIYDSYGVLIASTALAGQLLATANTWQTQAIALTYARGTTTSTAATSVKLSGPQQYYIAVQGNGTTAGAIQTVPAPYQICAAAIAAGTFGTIPATITPPTTFTAAKAPIVYLS